MLSKAPGVSIINDRAANRFPTPLDASNQVSLSDPHSLILLHQNARFI